MLHHLRSNRRLVRLGHVPCAAAVARIELAAQKTTTSLPQRCMRVVSMPKLVFVSGGLISPSWIWHLRTETTWSARYPKTQLRPVVTSPGGRGRHAPITNATRNVRCGWRKRIHVARTASRRAALAYALITWQ